MPTVKIKLVVSFSSQCERFPCINILRGGQWLSKSGDKNRRLEAIFQLENATKITHIDIGTVWAKTLQIQVGRSSWPSSQSYEVLFQEKHLMTNEDCRNHSNTGPNIRSMQMLKPEDFTAAKEKEWDRVKIILTQPIRREIQFGVSLLQIKKLSTEGEETAIKSPERTKLSEQTNTAASTGSTPPSTRDIQKHFFGKGSKRRDPTDQVKERLLKMKRSEEHGSEQEASLSRNAKLVLESSKHTPHYKGSTPPTTERRKGKIPFDKEVDNFLASLNRKELDLDKMTYADLRHRLEKRLWRKLSKEEKKIFTAKVATFIANITGDQENTPKSAKKPRSPAASSSVGRQSSAYQANPTGLQPQSLFNNATGGARGSGPTASSPSGTVAQGAAPVVDLTPEQRLRVDRRDEFEKSRGGKTSQERVVQPPVVPPNRTSTPVVPPNRTSTSLVPPNRTSTPVMPPNRTSTPVVPPNRTSTPVVPPNTTPRTSTPVARANPSTFQKVTGVTPKSFESRILQLPTPSPIATPPSTDNVWLSRNNPPTASPASTSTRGRGLGRGTSGRGQREVHNVSSSSGSSSLNITPADQDQGRGRGRGANGQSTSTAPSSPPRSRASKLIDLTQDWSPVKDIQPTKGKKTKKRKKRANLEALRATLANHSQSQNESQDSSFEQLEPPLKKRSVPSSPADALVSEAGVNHLAPMTLSYVDDTATIDNPAHMDIPPFSEIYSRSPPRKLESPPRQAESLPLRAESPPRESDQCGLCNRRIKPYLMETHMAVCGVIDSGDEDATLADPSDFDLNQSRPLNIDAYQATTTNSASNHTGASNEFELPTSRCPICYQDIPSNEINFHVNICLDSL